MKENRTLILDLDECLIHSEYADGINYDFYKSSFDILDGSIRTMIRPNLSEFLDYAFSNFNIAIWTAAGEKYAEAILEKVGIYKSSLSFFYTEKNCTAKYNYGDGWGMGHMTYLKNISKLRKKGYDMSRILMIDDKPEYIDSYGNVISINPFYGDSNDTELKKMIKYLDIIKDDKDYRKVNKLNWVDKI